MYYHDGSVYLETDDQCITCKNFAKGVACPLLQALGMGVVTLEESLTVSNCQFYEESQRHLSVVVDPEDENQKIQNISNVRKLHD